MSTSHGSRGGWPSGTPGNARWADGQIWAGLRLLKCNQKSILKIIFIDYNVPMLNFLNGSSWTNPKKSLRPSWPAPLVSSKVIHFSFHLTAVERQVDIWCGGPRKAARRKAKKPLNGCRKAKLTHMFTTRTSTAGVD